MLTPAWFPLRQHRLQSMMWRTRCRFVAAACGRGSGKTEIARRYIIRMLPVRKSWSDPMYFYALPTRDQAKRVAWAQLKDLIPPAWIEKISESDLIIKTVFGSSLHLVGMDAPQRIEGSQWDGCILDESSDQKPGAFSRSVVPALSHRTGFCMRIGVPKRTGCGAAEFKDFCLSGSAPGTLGAEIEYYNWPSSSVLTPEQLRWAREHLDPKDYAEQYEASWENVGGLCHYAYDDALNVADYNHDPSRPLIIGSDFNVDPMAWVVGQLSPDEKSFYIFDELWIRNTSTQGALDELARRYSTHVGGFDFFGDASSRARNTRTTETDYMQIRADKRFTGARVFYPLKNPAVTERFACVNRLCCNANDERHLFVAPKCTNLRRDLTTRAYKQQSNEPDDYGDVGHISDALGYPVHKIFPVTYTLDRSPTVHVEAA